MEVSKRVLGLLTAVAVGAALWLFARETTLERAPRRSQSPERAAVKALTDSVNHLALLVRTAEIRKRVELGLRSAPVGRAPSGVVLVVGGGAAAAMAPTADSLLDSLAFPAVPRIPVRMALVDLAGDSASPRGPRNFTILPSPSTGSSCISVRVVVPGEVADAQERWGWQRRSWVGSLGPCWYLATFGPPGPAVRAWLDARYWDVARRIPPHLEPDPISNEASGASSALLRLLGEMPSSFAGGSATLDRCATDSPKLCEVSLLESPYQRELLPAGIVENQWAISRDWRQYSWLTDLPSWATESVLASMVDDLGPTRFQALWTSTAPVGEAFETAAGMPLGEWFGQRLRRGLQRAGIPDPGRGPEWASVIGLLGLALGAALWGAGRRRVR
jgi:hypothetical protein